LSNVHLISTWKSGWYLVESDPDLTLFKPGKKLKEAEQSPGIDLLNPFRTDTYGEVENEEPPNPMLQQPQQATSTSSMLALLELEVLADSEHACQNGLESMVEIGDGKQVHKARILREFTRFTRTLNSTDCLRHVANISRFAPPPPVLNCHIRDDSVMETDHILIQDVVAVLLQCNGAPFLGVAQVNSIKLDKNPQSVVPKDLLNEVTVSIGVQILSLKPSNSTLSNGKESNWVWNHGYNVNVTIPGKTLQQISLDVIEIGEDSQRKVVGYGFHSNELRELAAMMFGMLSPEDVRKVAEVRCTDNFPYQFNGKLWS